MSFPDDFKSVKASNIAEIDSYQDKAASKDSQLKAIWDEQMGAKNIAVAYRQAHVLLLSWHPEDDDLHVDQEVSNLRVRLGGFSKLMKIRSKNLMMFSEIPSDIRQRKGF